MLCTAGLDSILYDWKFLYVKILVRLWHSYDSTPSSSIFIMILSSAVCVYEQEEPFKSQHFFYGLTSAVEHLAKPSY